MRALGWMVLCAAGAAFADELPALASTQRVVFENADVRVTEVNMAPGASEAEHYHARGVTIALSDYQNETTALPDGRVTSRATKFGEVRWVDPAHHKTRNTGSTAQRVIRIELKNPTPGSPSQLDAFDSVIAAKDTQRVLIENADVRVVEERTPPGVAQPKHRHRKSVLVPLVDSELEIANIPSGDASAAPEPKVRRKIQALTASWNPPSLHEVGNVGSTEALNIRVEIK